MKDLVRVSAVDLPPMRDTNWRIAGVGDFDGSGKPGLFWRNATTGANAVWRVTGSEVVRDRTAPGRGFRLGGRGPTLIF